jgi:5-methylcytosine-specific restriction endonuclease McrBC regulatory subunit McrC
VKEKERRGRWGSWAAGGGFGPDGEVGRWRKTGQRAERKKGRERVRSFLFYFFSTFSNPFQTLNSFQSLNTSNLLQVFKLF